MDVLCYLKDCDSETQNLNIAYKMMTVDQQKLDMMKDTKIEKYLNNMEDRKLSQPLT